MPQETRIVTRHFKPRHVRADDGATLIAPDDWSLLPPGDAGLTRRVKAAGPTWTVQEKKGRKTFSHGVWAATETIENERKKIEAERETPAYKKKRAADKKRRERDHAAYVEEFRGEVAAFLDFHADHVDLQSRLADAVTELATPVGSGTVARTKRIEVDKRAEAAVIAWMRHQTTAYDDMKIARVKGRRREVRGELAKRSRKLLQDYRDGREVDTTTCPLARALSDD